MQCTSYFGVTDRCSVAASSNKISDANLYFSDGKTYSNECTLQQRSCDRPEKIKVAYTGPCGTVEIRENQSEEPFKYNLNASSSRLIFTPYKRESSPSFVTYFSRDFYETAPHFYSVGSF